MSNYTNFKQLHEQAELFVLPNAWNVKSAKALEESNFKAIGTSSDAVAQSLGYKDGEQLSFEEYLYIAGRIAAAVNIPLTVDLEMGYAETPAGIHQNLLHLAEAGVAGINIEDSHFMNGSRQLKESSHFASKLSAIKQLLASSGTAFFINVRCDTYLLNVDNKQEETNARIKQYEAAGADGIFLPCITQEADIKAAVAATKLPLNVMAMPGLPDLDVLNRAGVKRVSLGSFLFESVYKNVKTVSEQIIKDKTTSGLFA